LHSHNVHPDMITLVGFVVVIFAAVAIALVIRQVTVMLAAWADCVGMIKNRVLNIARHNRKRVIMSCNP
jgi:hypothetical protein